MIYRLLGELEIGEGGQLVRLPSGVTLVLLAALLVNANRPLSADELIRAAWSGTDVQQAQLHKRINAVRALLEQTGRRDDLITHHGLGYELRAATEDLDGLWFQHLVQEAARAESEHRTDDEIRSLRKALSLWRGPRPLSNVPAAALYQEVATLERRRKRAAARLFAVELSLGNHENVLDELITIAGSYPSDRRLSEQLMLAAYRCGHLADVANAYERYREALAEQTGGTPDSLLRTFHFAVARGDEAAIRRAESDIAVRAGASARPVAAVPRQLPRPAELVGRDDMVAEVSWLLRRESSAAAPVVVISGPGGIGKTALAVRAAHESSDRYPDGQLYAELRGTAGGVETGEVLAQFLRAFEAPRVPETTQERLAAYRTLLAGRRVLVVLDDATDGNQVSELIPANPRCAVLVTARERLPEVSGSHHVPPLEPLQPEDATELFLRAVRDAGISAEDDLAAAGRVVALCGGLPLALRIAAALRVQAHPRPTAELANRLARQGPAAFTYKNLNLARTIGTGFDRLDDAAQQLFLGLGLLAVTSFGQWTAAALLEGTYADPTAALSQLAASFMIEPAERDMRYLFHDLTREYSRRRALAEYPGDHGQVPALAYRALLALTRHAHTRLYGGDFEVIHSTTQAWAAPPEALAEIDASPLDWFEKEHSNIRAAVGHCAALGLTDMCWDLAVSAHEFYSIRGYFDDWYATHTVALDACRQAGDRRGEGIVLACLNQPALVASRRADGAAALADLERAAALLAECGDRHGQAIALRTLANALYRQGHLTRTLALFNEALGHYEASRDTVGRWQTLRFIGQTHLLVGRHDDARLALEQALAFASELGRERLIAQTRYWAGQVCLATGNLDGAQAAFGAVLDTYRNDTGLGHAYAVHGLGDVTLRKGDYERAEQHLTEAATLAREGADAFLEGRAWLSTAALHHARGQPEEQIMALEQAAAVFAGCGAAYLEARAAAALARALADRDDVVGADRAWARIEDLYNAAGLPEQDRLHRRAEP